MKYENLAMKVHTLGQARRVRTKRDAKDVVEFLSFLMTVMYNLPHQIAEYRKRKP